MLMLMMLKEMKDGLNDESTGERLRLPWSSSSASMFK
jgi:hypothetical protein